MAGRFWAWACVAWAWRPAKRCDALGWRMIPWAGAVCDVWLRVSLWFFPNPKEAMMEQYFNDLYRDTMRLLMQMEREHWVIAFGVLVVVGFFCMRGFGSRTSY